MTAPDGNGAPRSRSGCATAVGVGLVLVGGLALAINLAGARLALFALDLLPHLALWWPGILIVWGLWKLATRLRGGRTRFGFGEIVLLLLVLLCGTGLTLARQIIEGQNLEFRFSGMRRWAEERAAPLPQHAFVTERVIALPAEGPVELALDLPAGGILVETGPVEEDAAETAEPAVPAATAADPHPETPEAETPDAPESSVAPREARLTLTKRVWAEDAEEGASRAGAVRLTAGPMAGDRARMAVGVEDAGEWDIALDLVVTAPPGVRISAASGRGPIRIRGPFAAVSARGSHGPLEVSGAAGEVSLSARDGVVRATGIGGSLRVRGRRSVIEIESVEGAVSVESDGAPVWISEVRGPVTVVGEDGPIEVSEAVGPVTVEARIAPVTLRRIAREARVRADHGAVLALAVGGRLDIRAETATVEVRSAGSGVDIAQTDGILLLDRVAGPVAVAGGRGEVLASGLAGSATIAADAGAITVRGFRGPLEVDGGDAALEVTAETLDGEISLTTGAGDVRLSIPRDASFTLRAQSGEGEVTSDFDLERVREDRTAVWVGSAGAGSPLVAVSTASGDVEIRSGEGRSREPS